MLYIFTLARFFMAALLRARAQVLPQVRRLSEIAGVGSGSPSAPAAPASTPAETIAGTLKTDPQVPPCAQDTCRPCGGSCHR